MDELLEDTVVEVCEAIGDCIDEPAGSGCGYGITDEGVSGIIEVLKSFSKKFLEVYEDE